MWRGQAWRTEIFCFYIISLRDILSQKEGFTRWDKRYTSVTNFEETMTRWVTSSLSYNTLHYSTGKTDRRRIITSGLRFRLFIFHKEWIYDLCVFVSVFYVCILLYVVGLQVFLEVLFIRNSHDLYSAYSINQLPPYKTAVDCDL